MEVSRIPIRSQRNSSSVFFEVYSSKSNVTRVIGRRNLNNKKKKRWKARHARKLFSHKHLSRQDVAPQGDKTQDRTDGDWSRKFNPRIRIGLTIPIPVPNLFSSSIIFISLKKKENFGDMYSYVAFIGCWASGKPIPEEKR